MDVPSPPAARCLAEDVLGDAGLASAVLTFLLPPEIAPLRELSRAVRDSIAAIPFGPPPARHNDTSDVAGDDAIFHDPRWMGYVVRGPAALAGWRACFPAARALAYSDDGSSEPLGEAELELLSGFSTLRLSDLGAASAAALDARVLGSVTSLALADSSLEDLRFLRHVSPRLAAVSLVRNHKRFTADDSDDEGEGGGPLPSFDVALAWLAQVPDVEISVGDRWGHGITETGIARLVSARSRILFNETETPVTGAGFEPLRQLSSLSLRYEDFLAGRLGLTQAFFTHVAGRLQHLALDIFHASSLVIRGLLADDSFAHFTKLTSLEVFGELDPERVLHHIPAATPLARLRVGYDNLFTGTAVVDNRLPHLRRLEVFGCPWFMSTSSVSPLPQAADGVCCTDESQLLGLESVALSTHDSASVGRLADLVARCPRLRHVNVTAVSGTATDPTVDVKAALLQHGVAWSFSSVRGDEVLRWTAVRGETAADGSGSLTVGVTTSLSH